MYSYLRARLRRGTARRSNRNALAAEIGNFQRPRELSALFCGSIVRACKALTCACKALTCACKALTCAHAHAACVGVHPLPRAHVSALCVRRPGGEAGRRGGGWVGGWGVGGGRVAGVRGWMVEHPCSKGLTRVSVPSTGRAKTSSTTKVLCSSLPCIRLISSCCFEIASGLERRSILLRGGRA